MTVVYAIKNGNNYALSVRGHATGSEKVCAGISAIVYALEGFFINFPECIKEKKSEFNDGEVNIVFFGNKEAYYAFMMTVIGLKQIEASHPEYIRVNFSEK